MTFLIMVSLSPFLWWFNLFDSESMIYLIMMSLSPFLWWSILSFWVYGDLSI